MLTPEELAKVQQHLAQLDIAPVQARASARSLLLSMNSTNMASTFRVPFDPEGLNTQLNSILFDSANFGESMTKLRLAQQQTEFC